MSFNGCSGAIYILFNKMHVPLSCIFFNHWSVSTMVVDALAPTWRQDICNHHGDPGRLVRLMQECAKLMYKLKIKNCHIIPTFSSLVATDVAMTTTLNAPRDDKFGVLISLGFQRYWFRFQTRLLRIFGSLLKFRSVSYKVTYSKKQCVLNNMHYC